MNCKHNFQKTTRFFCVHSPFETLTLSLTNSNLLSEEEEKSHKLS